MSEGNKRTKPRFKNAEKTTTLSICHLAGRNKDQAGRPLISVHDYRLSLAILNPHHPAYRDIQHRVQAETCLTAELQRLYDAKPFSANPR
jgi:hypothetical protein